jgi:hypothetical protein
MGPKYFLLSGFADGTPEDFTSISVPVPSSDTPPATPISSVEGIRLQITKHQFPRLLSSSLDRPPCLRHADMASEISTEDAYGKMLSDGLRQLDLASDSTAEADSPSGEREMPRTASALSHTASTSRIRDGYGFRPPSGVSTPASGIGPQERDSPLPDVHGLGWPGEPAISRTRWLSDSLAAPI